jgi:hypothetical protein
MKERASFAASQLWEHGSMILGLSLATFTLVHVVISLVGIATGIVVLLGMLRGHELAGWTGIFLATTLLTSLTGFLFPITAFTPALAVGALSTAILAAALLALYVFDLAGVWRPVISSPRLPPSISIPSSPWCRRSRSSGRCTTWHLPSPSRRFWQRKASCWRCSSWPLHRAEEIPAATAAIRLTERDSARRLKPQ